MAGCRIAGAAWAAQQHDVHGGGAQGQVGEGAVWPRAAGMWRRSQCLSGDSDQPSGPQDLKELCKQVGAPVKSKKEDIVAALLAAQAQQAVEDDVPAGLEELEDVPAEAGAAGGGDDAAAAADGKHASIVFKLDEKKVCGHYELLLVMMMCQLLQRSAASAGGTAAALARRCAAAGAVRSGALAARPQP